MQKISQSQNRIFSWIFPHFSSFCCSLTLFIICFFFFPLFICELRVYWFLFAFLKHFLVKSILFLFEEVNWHEWQLNFKNTITDFWIFFKCFNLLYAYLYVCLFVLYFLYQFQINFVLIALSILQFSLLS